MLQPNIGTTPPQFVAKWAVAALSERASAQEHFGDLCRLLGQPTPAEADPAGEWYAFEKGVTTTLGRQGFADVWKRGCFAWEYKGKGKHVNLKDAYDQLLLYREDLENPPLLVVCDIEHYEVHTNFTGTVKQVHRFRNEDLTEPETLRLLRGVFTNPEALRPEVTPQKITREAAQKFASIADGLRDRGVEPHRAARFLTRLLFCLFAEDIGLLPKGLFAQLLGLAVRRPDAFTRQTLLLFEAMRDGGIFGLHEIVRFNGSLFVEPEAVELTPEELALLVEAARLDWSSIEPAIFGTLFERGLDPAKRAQLGAHYTSRDDILLIVEPVLMAPLRREWDHVRERADTLVAGFWSAGDSRGKRERARRELESLLRAFHGRLIETTVLDPACGSGNFLYVSLNLLLELEKEVITYAARAGLPRMLSEVRPRQMRGIEINAYAHDLAQVAVWIGYLQWMSQNGMPIPNEPVLDPLDSIVRMDAILDRSDPAHPREPEWPAADVIVGNPPFLGDKRLRGELGDEYIDRLAQVYRDRVPGGADFCCYWFEKASEAIAEGKANRAGLLATNSIRGGANRSVLEKIKESGDIFMAWADRPWILDGAAVRVSMIGFDAGAEAQRTLDGQTVTAINPDLTSSTDVTIAQRLDENAGLSFMGDQKTGPFDIPATLAISWLSLPLNPNGRPNSDVVRPWVNGLDIARRPRNMWIIDFGVDMPKEQAALYEAPFEYVVKHVKPDRDRNRNEHLARFWWLHERPRPDMRRGIAGLGRFVCTLHVSKHRFFCWLDAAILPSNLVIVFARDDDYFFGVLHAKAHELWSLRMCTWLGKGNDPRYTPTTTFETYPFPWPPGQEPVDDPRVVAIAEAARELNELRERWLNPEGASEADLKKRTLTNLYNQRPSWLQHAHARLDRAVFAAYGWPGDLSDDEILARLLALNLERATTRDR